MGVKNFYYYDSPRLFAFASEIKALVCLKEIPRELNEVRVADFLVNMFDDREITFYKGVKRLPSASTLTASRERLGIHRYWTLDTAKEFKLGSDSEYAEAFRDVFTQAVRCRLRSAFPVASTLSGGLDSSAVACLAQKLLAAKGERLHTLSAIFPGAPTADLEAIDERRFIQAALATGDFEPHYIRADELSPMRQNDRMHFHLDEANFAPNLYLHWAMYEEAAKHGVRVLLDGFDGDTTVSHGFARLPELLFSLRWGTLAQELRLIRRNLLPKSSLRRIFWNLCVKPSTPVWAFRLKRLMQGRISEFKGNPTLIEPSFARSIGIDSRVRQMSGSRQFRPKNTRECHLEGITDPTYAWALEAADKSAAAFGIEARYPFFDKRLIEFCLALPADQKLGQGWNRMVMRRATEGILPPEIQWRPKKGNLSSNFYRKFLDLEGATLEEVVRSHEPACFGRFVSKPAMQAAYQHFQSEPMRNNQQAVQLFAAVNLALWLRQSALSN
jgi:asparagine synthase (glutamine-hydrolysing)